MENFLQSVLSPTRAPTMQEKAKELLRLIEEKVSATVQMTHYLLM